MLSLLVWPKVITLSGFYCIKKIFIFQDNDDRINFEEFRDLVMRKGLEGKIVDKLTLEKTDIWKSFFPCGIERKSDF